MAWSWIKISGKFFTDVSLSYFICFGIQILWKIAFPLNFERIVDRKLKLPWMDETAIPENQWTKRKSIHPRFYFLFYNKIIMTKWMFFFHQYKLYRKLFDLSVNYDNIVIVQNTCVQETIFVTWINLFMHSNSMTIIFFHKI